MCKSAEETAEAGKARQQELAEEVSALGAELSQAREQVASMDFLLTEKEVDVANKEKELAVRAAEITRKQEELDWERGERAKARVEAAEAVRQRDEMERKVVELQAALERAEGVRRYLMESGVRDIVAKIFASDDYVFEVAGLVPKLQATGRVALLQELKEEYFPGKELKELPGYVENALDTSNAAFAEMQKGPRKCHILDELAARPEMNVEEIKALQMPTRRRPSGN